jgi:hypothetical protein
MLQRACGYPESPVECGLDEEHKFTLAVMGRHGGYFVHFNGFHYAISVCI